MTLDSSKTRSIYLYDGETDLETVGVVHNSQQFYEPNNEAALRQRDKTMRERPASFPDGSARSHSEPLRTHFQQRFNINSWRTWGKSIDLDYLKTYGKVSEKDVNTVPNDSEARRAVFFYVALEASIALDMERTASRRESYGAADLGTTTQLPSVGIVTTQQTDIGRDLVGLAG